MRGRRVGLAAVLGALALGACELGDPVDGGPGGGLGPEQTANILSTDTLDGWVRANGIVATTGTQVVVGDLDQPGVSTGNRGYYSFTLAAIPAGATVTSAELRVHQFNVVGTPYVLGNVVADHVDYGATLDPTDYNPTILAANIGPVSAAPDTAFKSLSVTNRVRVDIDAGRERAQFRLRFSALESNNDGTPDYVQFTDREYVIEGIQPRLVVKFRMPAP